LIKIIFDRINLGGYIKMGSGSLFIFFQHFAQLYNVYRRGIGVAHHLGLWSIKISRYSFTPGLAEALLTRLENLEDAFY